MGANSSSQQDGAEVKEEPADSSYPQTTTMTNSTTSRRPRISDSDLQSLLPAALQPGTRSTQVRVQVQLDGQLLPDVYDARVKRKASSSEYVVSGLQQVAQLGQGYSMSGWQRHPSDPAALVLVAASNGAATLPAPQPQQDELAKHAPDNQQLGSVEVAPPACRITTNLLISSRWVGALLPQARGLTEYAVGVQLEIDGQLLPTVHQATIKSRPLHTLPQNPYVNGIPRSLCTGYFNRGWRRLQASSAVLVMVLSSTDSSRLPLPLVAAPQVAPLLIRGGTTGIMMASAWVQAVCPAAQGLAAFKTSAKIQIDGVVKRQRYSVTLRPHNRRSKFPCCADVYGISAAHLKQLYHLGWAVHASEPGVVLLVLSSQPAAPLPVPNTPATAETQANAHLDAPLFGQFTKGGLKLNRKGFEIMFPQIKGLSEHKVTVQVQIDGQVQQQMYAATLRPDFFGSTMPCSSYFSGIPRAQWKHLYYQGWAWQHGEPPVLLLVLSSKPAKLLPPPSPATRHVAPAALRTGAGPSSPNCADQRAPAPGCKPTSDAGVHSGTVHAKPGTAVAQADPQPQAGSITARAQPSNSRYNMPVSAQQQPQQKQGQQLQQQQESQAQLLQMLNNTSTRPTANHQTLCPNAIPAATAGPSQHRASPPPCNRVASAQPLAKPTPVRLEPLLMHPGAAEGWQCGGHHLKRRLQDDEVKMQHTDLSMVASLLPGNVPKESIAAPVLEAHPRMRSAWLRSLLPAALDLSPGDSLTVHIQLELDGQLTAQRIEGRIRRSTCAAVWRLRLPSDLPQWPAGQVYHRGWRALPGNHNSGTAPLLVLVASSQPSSVLPVPRASAPPAAHQQSDMQHDTAAGAPSVMSVPQPPVNSPQAATGIGSVIPQPMPILHTAVAEIQQTKAAAQQASVLQGAAQVHGAVLQAHSIGADVSETDAAREHSHIGKRQCTGQVAKPPPSTKRRQTYALLAEPSATKRKRAVPAEDIIDLCSSEDELDKDAAEHTVPALVNNLPNVIAEPTSHSHGHSNQHDPAAAQPPLHAPVPAAGATHAVHSSPANQPHSSPADQPQSLPANQPQSLSHGTHHHPADDQPMHAHPITAAAPVAAANAAPQATKPPVPPPKLPKLRGKDSARLLASFDALDELFTWLALPAGAQQHVARALARLLGSPASMKLFVHQQWKMLRKVTKSGVRERVLGVLQGSLGLTDDEIRGGPQ